MRLGHPTGPVTKTFILVGGTRLLPFLGYRLPVFPSEGRGKVIRWLGCMVVIGGQLTFGVCC
jgi:hypothetical protein